METSKVLKWLLDGDPSIRWQTLRDLAGAEDTLISKERGRVATEGWGAKLLSFQDDSGRWGGQLYGNKWLSTTYSMLLLRQMGLEPDHPQAQLACRELLEGGFKETGGISYARSVSTIDNGVTGMILSLLAYFDFRDERIHAVAEYLINQQLPDGRWEPFPGNQQLKYTFDGTLLILDGLWEYGRKYPQGSKRVTGAQKRGREFLLSHRLFKTGPDQIIDKKMTLFSFPPRWHYDVLAALDLFQNCNADRDERLMDTIELLISRQNRDGTWNLQNRHAGKTYFEMEEVGKPSRWNTLRALRVLKWWGNN